MSYAENDGMRVDAMDELVEGMDSVMKKGSPAPFSVQRFTWVLRYKAITAPKEEVSSMTRIPGAFRYQPETCVRYGLLPSSIR